MAEQGCSRRNGADLVIRPMSRGQLDLAVQWAADEGWNLGLKDADCFYQTDPDGSLLRRWRTGGHD
jgi:hypothetical protein